ncbi:Protein NRT1/ PTR FAMILY 1.1 [Linum perenne]
MEDNGRSLSDENERTKPLICNEIPKRSTKGGFRTMPFIILNEALQSVANTGLYANMVIYLTTEFKMEAVSAGSIIFLWSAASSFLGVFGAMLSDSFLGRFTVILIGSSFCLLNSHCPDSLPLFKTRPVTGFAASRSDFAVLGPAMPLPSGARSSAAVIEDDSSPLSFKKVISLLNCTGHAHFRRGTAHLSRFFVLRHRLIASVIVVSSFSLHISAIRKPLEIPRLTNFNSILNYPLSESSPEFECFSNS